MSDPTLNGRVAVVSGAFGQLGRAVCRAFAASGAKVAALDRAAVAAPPGDFGSADTFAQGGIDFSDLAHAETAMSNVVQHFGRIDILVNTAGGFLWQPLADGDVAVWDQMFVINLKTAVVASKSVLPHLFAAGGGRIVNIGAGAAARAAAGMGAYTAAKSGVMRLTESLSQELAARGITVNAVLPGTIDTPQNRKDMPGADRSKWVSTDEIADVVVFLASHAARAVTGVSIPVFGRG